MPHTLTAVAAFALLGYVIMEQARVERHDQQGAIRTEIQAASQSVAAEVHEAIAALPFDAVATNDTLALTPEALFGSLPAARLADAEDLDDVHEIEDTLIRSVSDPDTGALQPIEFTVSARVHYVRASGGTVVTTGSRTLTKLAHITVDHPSLLTPLHVRRVYSL